MTLTQLSLLSDHPESEIFGPKGDEVMKNGKKTT